MEFCMQIVKDLMLEEIRNGKNTILSPLSINVLLNMIAAGTTGATLKLMLSHLGFESIEEVNDKSCEIMAVANNKGKRGPIVTSINGVWTDKQCPLKASYEELLKRIYNCEANKSCDFANKEAEVREEINAWADAASRGTIKRVLDNPLDPMTRFVRANALYFKGSWSEPFDPEDTRDLKFYLLDGTIVQVPFLRGPSLLMFDYGSFDGYKVLRVPYENGKRTSFSMYFFLPDKRDGVQILLETFKSNPKLMFQDLKHTDMNLVQIPKFKFPYGCDITDTMEKMGLEVPYKQNHLDYAEMIQNPENLPSLSMTIIQKAFIEVDEYGTEASAVTVEELLGCSLDYVPPEEVFVADHPFMFAIREDESGFVFFTGIVLNPEDSNE